MEKYKYKSHRGVIEVSLFCHFARPNATVFVLNGVLYARNSIRIVTARFKRD